MLSNERGLPCAHTDKVPTEYDTIEMRNIGSYRSAGSSSNIGVTTF